MGWYTKVTVAGVAGCLPNGFPPYHPTIAETCLATASGKKEATLKVCEKSGIIYYTVAGEIYVAAGYLDT